MAAVAHRSVVDGELQELPLALLGVPHVGEHLGGAQEQQPHQPGEQRHDREHPDGDDDAGAAPQGGDPGIGSAPGSQAGEDRPYAGEQVGDADEVGEDEVAVEPDHRQQLLGHLEVDQEDHEHQGLPTGGVQRPP